MEEQERAGSQPQQGLSQPSSPQKGDGVGLMSKDSLREDNNSPNKNGSGQKVKKLPGLQLKRQITTESVLNEEAY